MYDLNFGVGMLVCMSPAWKLDCCLQAQLLPSFAVLLSKSPRILGLFIQTSGIMVAHVRKITNTL